TVPSWTLTGGRGSPHVRDFRRRAGMNVDDAVIEELTLLLLDLTSWTEDGLGTSVRRAWKGSLFETLDALEAKGFLTRGRRAKSVYVTDAGTTRAAELRKKALG